mmetsp:Transcript_8855/g.19996  ORF Transcript_8855/g.19996 Transcript_8855/m.19996 type:complete len:396 (-) Transcript_8855:149-1336(-)
MLKGHKAAVHSCQWSLDGLQIFSAGDDKCVKSWDVPTEACVWTQNGGHGDFVRSSARSPASPNSWASGGYDNAVCLWDLRNRDSRPAFKMDHGHPVEDLLFLPSGGLLLSAGGPLVQVWDIIGGCRPITSLSNHQKSVTSLCLDSTRSRLLTGGLDGSVKIHSIQTYAVTHSLRYELPILSLTISPDNSQIVVGTSDSSLITRQRETKAQAAPKQRSAIPPEQIPGGTAKYFERGKGLKTGGDNRSAVEDMQGVAVRKAKLRPYDLALKKFKYQDALDAALASRNPTVVVTVLEELVQRQGLIKALAGRDECTLEPLLSFLGRYTTNPRYSSLLVDVCRVVFETYKPVLGQSEAIDELFTRLGKQVKLEVSCQREVLKLMGALDAVMSRPAGNAS